MWQGARVEELDSDDTDTQGVGLTFENKRFASDSLRFTGADLAPSSRARRSYDYGTEESSEDSEESEVEGVNALQVALRDKEEALVQSALGRIRRAQEKGKQEVKLNQDELDALEKRRKRMQSAATSKAREGSGSSGSGSERRQRSDRNLISVPITAAAAEPSGRKRAKSRRSEELLAHPPGAINPPGMLISGPDGLTYAPIGYYPPQAGSSRNTPPRPRSATPQQLRAGPPQYAQQGSNRHFSEGTRPASSSSAGSRRFLPDEDGWVPNSRRSSGSSQSHGVDPFEYQVSSEQPPPIPEQYMQGRRIVSGPPEVSYSSVRRNPLTGYSAAARAPSDPSLRKRRSYKDELGDSQDSSSEGEDESDDLGNGVQVFVEERERDRTVPRKPVSGGRRKGKGR